MPEPPRRALRRCSPKRKNFKKKDSVGPGPLARPFSHSRWLDLGRAPQLGLFFLFFRQIFQGHPDRLHNKGCEGAVRAANGFFNLIDDRGREADGLCCGDRNIGNIRNFELSHDTPRNTFCTKSVIRMYCKPHLSEALQFCNYFLLQFLGYNGTVTMK